MNPLIFRFLSRGEKLSLRLLFWILLFSSVFALMATGVQLYVDYRDSKQSLEISLSKIRESVLPSIAVATWNLDDEMLESILTGLLTQNGIVYAEILGTNKERLISAGGNDDENSFQRIYPIEFFTKNNAGEKVTIGQLNVTATLSGIYKELMDRTFVILLTQSFKTFFMVFCILMLLDRLIIRHLKYLSRWAKNVDLSKPEQLLELNRLKKGNGDAIDNVINAINTMQTNLIMALAKREQTEKLVYSIVNNSPSLIYAKDLDGRYTLVNQQYLATTGLEQEDVIGKKATDLFSESEAHLLIDHDSSVAEKKTAITFDEKIVLKGQVKVFMAVKFPIFDENNQLVGTGGVSTDVTERHKEEQKIKELNESLESKVKTRTEELEASLRSLKEAQQQLIESEKMSALGSLVAGVAHEINTPIGVGIMATSHLIEAVESLQKDYLGDSLHRETVENFITVNQDSLKILLHNLQRAANIISNFKQVAVDQSSEQRREFEVGEYLEEVAASVNPKVTKDGHYLRIEVLETIHADSYPGALAQVLTNLIINSLEHGFKGFSGKEIRITVSKRAKFVHIEYRDNGVGLNTAQIEKVFEPFYTTNRGDGGSGLGMSISYNLMTKVLQGTIRCNQSDDGAYFELEFPISLEEKRN